MLAYQHPIVTKEAFVALMRAHKEADQVRQQTYGRVEYFDGTAKGKFVGCAIGCAAHSVEELLGEQLKVLTDTSEWAGYEDQQRTIRASYSARYSDSHASLSRILGIPIELLNLQDDLFEALPQDAAMEFPLLFAEAVQVGADLSDVLDDYGMRLRKFASEHRSSELKMTLLLKAIAQAPIPGQETKP